MPRSKDPTRINLVRFHASHLSLASQASVEPSLLAEKLSGYAVKDAQGGDIALFHTIYHRDKVRHYCAGTIFQEKPGSDKFEFSLTYSTSPTMAFPPPGVTRSVAGMLEMLSNMPARQTFQCRASFEYPLDSYRSRVALPVVVNPEAELPYSEVRGMRLTKAAENGVAYDAIVDHGSGPTGAVWHSITFFYPGQFAVNLPTRVFGVAKEISGKFGGLYK